MIDLEHNKITRDNNIEQNETPNFNMNESRKIKLSKTTKVLLATAGVLGGIGLVNVIDANATTRVSHYGDSVPDYHQPDIIDRNGQELTLENMIGDYYYLNNGRAEENVDSSKTRKITDEQMLSLLSDQSKLKAYFLDNGSVYSTNPLSEKILPSFEKASYTGSNAERLTQANTDAEEFMTQYGLNDADVVNEDNTIVINKTALSK